MVQGQRSLTRLKAYAYWPTSFVHINFNFRDMFLILMFKLKQIIISILINKKYFINLLIFTIKYILITGSQ